MNLDDPELRGRLPVVDQDNPWLPLAVGREGLQPDPGCTRCRLHLGARHVCIGARGPEGAPLIIMGSPAQKDDVVGEFSTGGVNAIVEQAVRRHAPDARYVFAVRCPAGREASPVEVQACQPYLAHEFGMGPPRALVLGPVAAQAVTGQPFYAEYTRRAWAVVAGVPCFFVLNPLRAGRNRFLRRWLDNDIAWALTSPPRQAPHGEVRVALTADEARAALASFREGDDLAFDCEHWPDHWWAKGEFRLLCLGLCQDPAAPWVLPEAVIPQVIPELRAVLENPRIPKVGHHAKHDRHVIWRACGIDVAGLDWDTLVLARQMESESPAALAKLEWTVGLGGRKSIIAGTEDEEE